MASPHPVLVQPNSANRPAPSLPSTCSCGVTSGPSLSRSLQGLGARVGRVDGVSPLGSSWPTVCPGPLAGRGRGGVGAENKACSHPSPRPRGLSLSRLCQTPFLEGCVTTGLTPARPGLLSVSAPALQASKRWLGGEGPRELVVGSRSPTVCLEGQPAGHSGLGLRSLLPTPFRPVFLMKSRDSLWELLCR